MPIKFNLRHLDEKNLLLKEELSAEELELDSVDELVHISSPVVCDLEIQMMEDAVLVQGTLKVTLKCECARCLKPYEHQLELADWACHLALEGEEPIKVINDCVDLTPYIREDILLAFPQHPLCDSECRGLTSPRKDLKAGGDLESKSTSSAWAELNKLKLK